MSLDSTPGGNLADSYVSVAEADVYFFGAKKALWDALDTSAKEPLLKEATRLLDQFFDWSGTIDPVSTQSLRWPRINAYDQDERLIPSTDIPKAVKYGTIEFALYLNTNSGFDPSVNNLQLVKIGPIRLDFKAGSNDNSFPKMVMDLVSSVGSFKSVSMSSIGQPRLVRT